jgi:hypothetical protein
MSEVQEITGGWPFAVTFTVKFAAAVNPPLSATCNAIVAGPVAAVQSAPIVALMTPLKFVMPDTLIPCGAVEVTIRLAAGSSASVTVAMTDGDVALPCSRAIGAAGVIVGAALVAEVAYM